MSRMPRWRNQARTIAWDGIGIGSGLVFMVVHLLWPAGLVPDLLSPWLLGGFAASALRGRLTSRVLSWVWVPVVGGMCYSIYLVHARVLSVLLTKGFGSQGLTGSFSLDWLLIACVVFPIVVGISSIFYLLIERPCMDHRWPQKLWGRLGLGKQSGG